MVTGGAGKLGGFVVTRLISRGHSVTVFDRSCSAALDATIVTGDVLDLMAVLKAAEGVDANYSSGRNTRQWYLPGSANIQYQHVCSIQHT
jgi:nucleoside-diphosphate-sugar epimerase